MRWVLIQRSVTGILFLAVLMLVTLRYASYVGHEKNKEAEKMRQWEEDMRRDGGKRDHSSPADAALILAEGG